MRRKHVEHDQSQHQKVSVSFYSTTKFYVLRTVAYLEPCPKSKIGRFPEIVSSCWLLTVFDTVLNTPPPKWYRSSHVHHSSTCHKKGNTDQLSVMFVSLTAIKVLSTKVSCCLSIQRKLLDLKPTKVRGQKYFILISINHFN